MKLCIAEKPSVGREIAKVVGANQKREGYLEGNGYIVTWCVGHLVTLAEPEAYGFMSRKDIWSKEFPNNKYLAIKELPIIPEKFIHVVKKDTKKQYDIVKKLFEREDVDLIIDCGDMGPQGHYLQWLVRKQIGTRKKIMRFCTTSYTEREIRDAFNNLRDISEFTNIIKAEYCKAKGDFEIGMSFSRYYGHPVGRVITPTLGMVVNRYLQNVNFIAEKYYQVKCFFANGISGYVYKEKNNKFSNMEAAFVCDSIMGKSGTVTEYKKEERITNPPQLYDLTELQKDAAKYYGMSPNDTLQVAQNLYEMHKITTYPRSDSRYITDAMIPEYQERIEDLLGKKYANLKGGDFSYFTKRIVDGTKVEDHHAIIVNENYKNYDMDKLNPAEAKVLELICRRMMTAVAPVYKYESTSIEITVESYIVKCSFNKPLDYGFKGLFQYPEMDDKEKEVEVNFTGCIREGDVLAADQTEIQEKETKPLPLYTDASLLDAMDYADNYLPDDINENLRTALKRSKGIGTPATRGPIIKNMFDYGYVIYQKTGKKKSIIPTKLGLELIKRVPDKLKSVELTAEWEAKMADVRDGKYQESSLMDDINIYIREIFKGLDMEKGGYFSVEDKQSYDNNKGTESKEDSLGKCPYCSGRIISIGKYVKCENNKNDGKSCSFFLSLEKNRVSSCRKGKELTLSEVKKLLNQGLTTKCVSQSGNDYIGIFTINPCPDPKYGVVIDIAFNNGGK